MTGNGLATFAVERIFDGVVQIFVCFKTGYSAKYAGWGRLAENSVYSADFVAENLKMISKLFIDLPQRTAVVLRRVR